MITVQYIACAYKKRPAVFLTCQLMWLRALLWKPPGLGYMWFGFSGRNQTCYPLMQRPSISSGKFQLNPYHIIFLTFRNSCDTLCIMQIARWISLDAELFGQYALPPEGSRATCRLCKQKVRSNSTLWTYQAFLFINMLIDCWKTLPSCPVLWWWLVVAKALQHKITMWGTANGKLLKTLSEHQTQTKSQIHIISYRTIRLAPSFQGCTWQFSQSSAVYTEYLRCQG